MATTVYVKNRASISREVRHLSIRRSVALHFSTHHKLPQYFLCQSCEVNAFGFLSSLGQQLTYYTSWRCWSVAMRAEGARLLHIKSNVIMN